MNSLKIIQWRRGSVPATLVLIAVALSACTTTPESPQGSIEARNQLTALKNDPDLANRARVEVREAEEAVRLAEQPLPASDAELAEHRVYLAEQKVAIARARATARHAESERPRLAQERDAARLDARTTEANRAQADAEQAQANAEEAKAEANQAQAEAERARSEQASSADAAEREARELRRQIEALEAEATDRGIVLTLGDVLFATDSAELKAGAGRNLDQLVDFLRQYPERTAEIEGHTDSTGSADYNRRLSRQRADSVRDYLAGRGIAVNRLTTAGIGETRPIADNGTAAGRQQNRRVEVIIAHEKQARTTTGQ